VDKKKKQNLFTCNEDEDDGVEPKERKATGKNEPPKKDC